MADDNKKKGEPFPGTVEERPDDARPGTPLGGFADPGGTADTQEGGTTENPPPPPPPPDEDGPIGVQPHPKGTGG